ncbi:hypothetical protein [Actinobaculum sp. 313]|uniref:hypothetical protein n=1 Tax=Actinobaculum sp. 313 TaxID=2495645 RepID=UPI000D52719C|nr:hypothetical protein [Actinobaculum sp. 313]AWE43179.1 hypothetical protein DDD63_10975 [Actinobaculum sp. 313]
MGGLIVFLFIVFVAIIGVTTRALENNKVDRIREASTRLGLEYVGTDRDLGRYLGNECNVDRRATAKYVVTRRGRTYGVLQWTTGSGNNQTTHRRPFFTVAIDPLFPRTRIKPEGFFNFKHNDIETASEKFNVDWDIRSDSEPFALSFLVPAVRDWMYSAPFRELHLLPGLIVGLGGDDYEVEEFGHLERRMVELCQLVPPHVWGDYPRPLIDDVAPGEPVPYSGDFGGYDTTYYETGSMDSPPVPSPDQLGQATAYANEVNGVPTNPVDINDADGVPGISDVPGIYSGSSQTTAQPVPDAAETFPTPSSPSVGQGSAWESGQGNAWAAETPKRKWRGSKRGEGSCREAGSAWAN